jgi:lipopolysaccharide/colanic/teichoic acid biosynthesis glycosyltransferase
VIERETICDRLAAGEVFTTRQRSQDLGNASGCCEIPENNGTRRKRTSLPLAKRVLDIVGSGCLILMLAPLFLFVGLLIAITDGTPMIYRRRVVGPAGSFDAYKFRTMVRDADAKLRLDSEMLRAYQEQFKLRSDPRITPIGKWLRKYSVDELPQLFNVLGGQMSLVGPRMITAPELAKYGAYQDLLLSVKPGLTGYWQIEGRQEVSYSERVYMDVHYITNWSLTLDVMILLKTPGRVIFGRGAY